MQAHDTQATEMLDAYRAGAALFRGGFAAVPKVALAQASGDFIELVRDRFSLHEIGDWAVLVAPDTPVLHHAAQGTDVLVLGDVFDNDGGSVQARLDEIAQTKGLPATLARMDLGGRHGALIFRDGDVSAFNDPAGSRSVVFCTQDRKGIASHPELLAMIYDIPTAQDAATYMASPQYLNRIVRYLPGNRTAFEGVDRLLPNTLYATAENRMTRFWPYQERVEGTEEQMWDRFDMALDATRTYVAARFHPIVAVTGGIDTRAIVANFHRRQTPFTGVTWTNFNFKSAEREAIDRIVEVTGQPHYTITMPREDNAGPLLDLGSMNAGRIHMRGSRGVMMALCLEKMEQTAPLPAPPCFVMGYGGEILRGFHMMKTRDQDLPFIPKTMMEMFGVRGKDGKADKDMSAFIIRSFRAMYTNGHYASEDLHGYHPADLFYWEHRVGMWAALTMETIDPVMHSLIGINSRRLYEAGLNLPNRLRFSKGTIGRYIADRTPEIGEIPVV